jgi:hypothetical protein
MKPQLPQLHDATLTFISVLWKERTVTLSFKAGIPAPATIAITGHDFAAVEIPRQDPWGPSVSVLSAQIDSHDGRLQLSVEMQSGDTIHIVANAWSVESSS